MSETFQVDLGGIVDLLARHLYSSPRVYLRELLQNATDAITALDETSATSEGPSDPARRVDEAAGGAGVADTEVVRGSVTLRCGAGGTLEVSDSGVGLTLAEATELLATIGRSSKRDLELGTGREQFLGQFGIGLLSAFMVTDEIELVSRSSRTPDARAIRWTGYADGRYSLVELADDDPRAPARAGSTVRLAPRRDLEHWLEPATVEALAVDYGSLLPVDLRLEVEQPDGSVVTRSLSETDLPWERRYETDRARELALREYCESALGFAPLACIPLDLPVAGLSGVAYVLPSAVSPTTSSAHRVYLKRMLLGTSVDELLPPWAFFVRCVVNTTAVRPTASREGLYEDDILLATRDALGSTIRRWTLDTLAMRDAGSARLLAVHHLAVRALALVDDDMLDLAVEVLPFECTTGQATLAEIHERHGQIHFTPTVEGYRRIAPVAHAQDLPVVNAGYVYDADLLERVRVRRPSWSVTPVSASDVSQVLLPLEPLRALETTDALVSIRGSLAAGGCDVDLRTFEPSQIPSMLLDDRDADHEQEVSAAVSEADDLWGGVLGEFSQPSHRRRLILNDANPAVRDVLGVSDRAVREAGARALYVTALLQSGRPLPLHETDLMNDALSTLLRSATAARGAADDREGETT
ncbi:molecular chaperone of HSP90 family [Sanguibacter keddieii DSM 10542]|uniref:Molecular chaperone of HSP90 family n=1 Tax=Sanguibacter keddieii (strain ATCC 51767 / DSM 10542 / NCFB 3025 / ST-74) TaxID=446469 RepID=D1BJ33_SANKS|nr:HSP90 family protein [Sanguibacter keddieii]ACZ22227.1 molecular chaperone of HSP90 family [Sanguibacter keddieii DSM 10542]